MAKENSFDIVSKVDMQTLKDIVNVCTKIIKGRYDLKGGKNNLDLNEKDNTITFNAESEMALNSLKDIFSQAAIKRDVSTKAFEYAKPENASGGSIRSVATIKQGIDKENAKKISDLIKNSSYKVKSQIQDEQIRVSGKAKDDLQGVMSMLRSDENLDLALQFINFR